MPLDSISDRCFSCVCEQRIPSLRQNLHNKFVFRKEFLLIDEPIKDNIEMIRKMIVDDKRIMKRKNAYAY